MCDEGRLSYKRYQGEGRLLQPVQRGQGDWQPIDWKRAKEEIASALGNGSAIGGIVSAQSTNEEIFLFRRLVAAAGVGQVAGHSWSAQDVVSDEFLIDADKNPNTAGLRAQGLDPAGARGVINAALKGELSILVVLRTDLSEICTSEELDQLGDKLDKVVVLDTHYGPSVEIADLVVPIAAFGETEGSFVNRNGRVQRTARAIKTVGNSEEGWALLAELATSAGGDAGAVDAVADVFAGIAGEHAGFEGLTFAALGALGAPLATAGDGGA